jgi:hypothetical protein
MSNKNKTAVEWLVEQIESDKCKTAEDSKKIFQQAKAMEKQQIIGACYDWYTSLKYTDCIVITKLPEEYYKETYDIHTEESED